MTWLRALCGVGLSAVTSIAAAACAQGQDGIDLGSGGVTDPDGGSEADGARIPSRDGGGGGPDDSGTPKDDSGGGPGCTGKVVINELQANGPSNAEFIELFNPNSCAVSLSGWKLLYRSSEDNPGVPLYSFEAGDSIAAGDFLLLGNGNFQGAKQGNLGGGMGNSGGQVGLVDDTSKVVDAVGYSPGTQGLYTEGSPAPSPGSGSVGRKKDGVDTDNNAADFKAYTQHSAGAPNP